MSGLEAYQFSLLALCIWREAQNQPLFAKEGVAWVIRNRVQRGGWWGASWDAVILHPWQFSSFNENDPNATKFPVCTDPSFADSITAANGVFSAPLVPDPTGGADSYFDRSLDAHPPAWASTAVHTCDIGSFHFYKVS